MMGEEGRGKKYEVKIMKYERICHKRHKSGRRGRRAEVTGMDET
jgi:hypothetical protein